MSQIKGIIEAVSCKEGKDHPKYGKSWQTSIKVGDVWYGAFTKKDAAGLGLAKGKLVTFTWTENGDYKNFDPKSLSVSETASTTNTSNSGGSATGTGKGTWAGEKGVKVGHAINNAVNLAIYLKVPADKLGSELERLTGSILRLSKKVEANYDAILAGKTEATPAAAESEKPAAKPKATKPKAKPAPQPEPPPPEPEEEEVPPQPEQASEPDFDDDIPF